MSDNVKDLPWFSGEPYYCALCGAGGGEFMACEMPDCKLETRATAQERRGAHLIAKGGISE